MKPSKLLWGLAAIIALALLVGAVDLLAEWIAADDLNDPLRLLRT